MGYGIGSVLVARHVLGNAILSVRGIWGMTEDEVDAVKQEVLAALAGDMNIDEEVAASVIVFSIEGQTPPK